MKLLKYLSYLGSSLKNVWFGSLLGAVKVSFGMSEKSLVQVRQSQSIILRILYFINSGSIRH